MGHSGARGVGLVALGTGERLYPAMELRLATWYRDKIESIDLKSGFRFFLFPVPLRFTHFALVEDNKTT
jgi:hypothetical protein